MDFAYILKRIKKTRLNHAQNRFKIKNNAIFLHCKKLKQYEIQQMQQSYSEIGLKVIFLRPNKVRNHLSESLLKTLCYGNVWFACPTSVYKSNMLTEESKKNLINAYQIVDACIYHQESVEVNSAKLLNSLINQIFCNLTQFKTAKN